jgi:U3 small nucleolar RNA-associated protein 25
LSSIELLIMDQTDIFLMQNWSHLLHIMQHLHKTPKNDHGTDYGRVRLWYVIFNIYKNYYIILGH